METGGRVEPPSCALPPFWGPTPTPRLCREWPQLRLSWCLTAPVSAPCPVARRPRVHTWAEVVADVAEQPHGRAPT